MDILTPFLMSLIAGSASGIGGLMRHRRHPAAWHILGAGIIFTGAIILRTADKLACPIVQIAGRDFGTHSLWHCLNALTLYLLLIACIDHGQEQRRRQGESVKCIQVRQQEIQHQQRGGL